jgi:predicted transcriptional regulator
LHEDVSKFASKVMAENNLGFRGFAKEHELSLSMASKILKGSGNLTLETIAHIAFCNGKKDHIVFTD